MKELNAIDLLNYLTNEEVIKEIPTGYSIWGFYKWKATGFIYRHCRGSLHEKPYDEIFKQYYNRFVYGFDEYIYTDYENQKACFYEEKLITGLKNAFSDVLNGCNGWAELFEWGTIEELDKECVNDAIYLSNTLKRIPFDADMTIKLKTYQELRPIYSKCIQYEFDARVGQLKERCEELTPMYSKIVDAIELWEQEVEPFMRIYGHTNEDEEEAQDKRNEGEYVLQLPNELNTEKAQRVFNKAIGKGWVRANNDGFEWVGIDGKRIKAQLGYLCAEIYGYKYNAKTGNEGENIPYEALQRLFSVTRLDRAIQQVYEAQKPQLWRRQIDEIIE